MHGCCTRKLICLNERGREGVRGMGEQCKGADVDIGYFRCAQVCECVCVNAGGCCVEGKGSLEVGVKSVVM